MKCVWCVEWVFYFFTFLFLKIYISHLCLFYNCTYDFGKGLWHFSAWSAFYMGKLSPTCSCFKSPIVLRFPSIVYDVQNVAATAASQHYLGLNQRNWNPSKWICQRSQSFIFISLAQREFVNRRPLRIVQLLTPAFMLKNLALYHPSTKIWNGSCATTMYFPFSA